MDIAFAQESHVGMLRDENQDACGVFTAPPGCLFAVCDGMGGHAAGSTASRLAIATIGERFEAADAGVDPAQLLAQLGEAANRAVYEHAAAHPECAGMGTTCVLCLVAPSADHAFVAHVGDSRLYRLRGGQLVQITKDHTKVQRLVDQGVITAEQALHHPEAGVISRTLGVEPEVEIDVLESPLHFDDGDVYLLCTDGLTTMMDDDDIRDYLNEYAYLDVVRELVALANARGGYDNVTVQVIQVGQGRVAAGSTASGVASLSEVLDVERSQADREIADQARRTAVKVAVAVILAALALTLYWLLP